MSEINAVEPSRVKAISPDGRIAAATNTEGLLDFEFRDDPRLGDYTTDALAEQIAAVLRGLAAERRRLNGAPADAATHTRNGRFALAVDVMESNGRSPRRLVKLAIRGDHKDYAAWVHPLLLDTDPDTVSAELSGAYDDAVTSLQRQYGALMRHYLLD
ncbi:MAG TPA: hypothetical protein VE172_03390 [Stackebrandtia sp.]|jgi:hypothetical protein|uniref:hypothetical protein n=1 Tax=Stackebrandtia sp. TaxID=2023065 RepID=UPI002D6C5B0B|nr:hypothetical protein [Stackebrandtia sp.]HZE37832.1 hypothetical protein [Stackebrandtia sp.]